MTTALTLLTTPFGVSQKYAASSQAVGIRVCRESTQNHKDPKDENDKSRESSQNHKDPKDENDKKNQAIFTVEEPAAVEKRCFFDIPLPEVEPVDKKFLYDLEKDERGPSLDGLRLSVLSAIRDQETAIARELQTGDSELAQLTANNLVELNQMVSGLEETLCASVDNIPEMYEFQGPQNRDISLRAVSVEEGAELLQAKVIPVAEVCENIDTWREAIGEEVASVINKHKAGTFKTEDEVRAMEAKGEFQIVRDPGKLVAAIKPPRKLKARLVACGNFLQRERQRNHPHLIAPTCIVPTWTFSA